MRDQDWQCDYFDGEAEVRVNGWISKKTKLKIIIRSQLKDDSMIEGHSRSVWN